MTASVKAFGCRPSPVARLGMGRRTKTFTMVVIVRLALPRCGTTRIAPIPTTQQSEQFTCNLPFLLAGQTKGTFAFINVAYRTETSDLLRWVPQARLAGSRPLST